MKLQRLKMQFALSDYDVSVLHTPETSKLFNRLSSQGLSVVLLAHSTC